MNLDRTIEGDLISKYGPKKIDAAVIDNMRVGRVDDAVEVDAAFNFHLLVGGDQNDEILRYLSFIYDARTVDLKTPGNVYDRRSRKP